MSGAMYSLSSAMRGLARRLYAEKIRQLLSISMVRL